MSGPSWKRPCNDELLSSWLTRVALHSGCDPLTLTGAIWPKWRIWTTDSDRGLSVQRAISAAQWLECTPEVVHAATLQDLVDRLSGHAARYRPVLPWILALGNRNRQRYAGLPCCPQCLADDQEPFFRRTWRLAFVVGCEVHNTRLIDRCPYCHALIAPHLCISKLQNLARCAGCGQDMRRYVPSHIDLDALDFQRKAINVLAAGEGSWDNRTVSGLEWFRHMRGMLTPARCPVIRTDVQEPTLRPTNLLLEMQSPREREARLSQLNAILRGDAKPMRGYAKRKAEKSIYPVDKELVQADWERWLRRNRLW